MKWVLQQAALVLFLFGALLYSQSTFKLVGLYNDNWQVARAFSLAAQYMNRKEVEHIFKPNPSLNFTWEIVAGNTFENGSRAVELATNFLDTNVVGIVGPAVSSESVAVSQQVANVFKVPMTSYWSTSTVLSDKKEHPYFLRTIAADYMQARAMAELLYVYERTEIATIATNEQYGFNGIRDLKTFLNRKKITVASEAYFDLTEDPEPALLKTRASGKKVIVAIIANNKVRGVLLQTAHRLGMISKDFVWILSESFSSTFVFNEETKRIDITRPEIQNLDMTGLIFLKPTPGFWSKTKYFLENWNSDQTPQTVALHAFDAVLTFGYAIGTLIKQGITVGPPFDYQAIVKTIASSTNFMGASGKLRLNSDGDRLDASYAAINVINNSEGTRFAVWRFEDGLSLIHNGIVFPGGIPFNTVYPAGLVLAQSSFTEGIWSPELNPPSARQAYSVAVNEQTNELFIFGGEDDSQTLLSDLWVYKFSLNLWEKRQSLSIAPSSRKVHASFLNAEGLLYVFGGYNNRYFLNDMWKYDPATSRWKQVETQNDIVEPRCCMATAQASESIVYIMGGEATSSFLNDVWQFDLVTERFKLLLPADPSLPVPKPRAKHCSAYYMGKLYIWGGFLRVQKMDKVEVFNDLWAFDVEKRTWQAIPQENTPDPMYAMTCSRYDNRMILSNGILNITDTFDSSVYELDLAATLMENRGAWKVIYKPMLNSVFAPRANVPYAVFDKYLIVFGGKSAQNLLNDMWVFNIYDKSFFELHPTLLVPKPLSDSAIALVGDTAFVFGGKTEEGLAENKLYSFNIPRAQWNIILANPTKDSFPSRRFEHCAVTIGDRYFILFGKTNEGDYLSDVWSYSTSFNEWEKLHLQNGSAPIPRAGATAQAFGSKIYVYGGYSDQRLFNELWVLDVQQLQWQPISIPPEAHTPYPHIIRLSSSITDSAIMLYGGIDNTQHSTPYLFLYNVFKNTWSSVWMDFTLIFASVSAISANKLLIFGGDNNGLISSKLLIANIQNNSLVTEFDISNSLLSYGLPAARIKHNAVIFGNKFLIFGGIGEISGRRSDAKVFSDVWSIRIPLCDAQTHSSAACISCGLGQYQYLLTCIECGKGYYSDDFQPLCKPCPLGSFSEIVAANNVQQCNPCPFQTFNNATGMSSCLPCPEDMICPLGSINPQRLILNQTTNPTAIEDIYALRSIDPVISAPDSIQPVPLAKKDYRNTLLLFLSYTAAGVLAAIIMVVMLIFYKKGSFYYRKFDTFKSKHYNKVGVVHIKKTVFGGFLTVGFYLTIVAFLINSLVPMFDDNYSEDRTLIPNLAIARPIYGNIKIRVEVLGRAGDCTINNICAPNIRVIANGFANATDQSSQGYHCSNQKLAFPTAAGYSETCVVEYFCNSCVYGNTDLAGVRFLFNEPISFAQGYRYNITTTTGFPDGQISSLQGFILSQASKLFRGGVNSAPTEINMELYQTSYTYSQSGSTTTGYHIAYRSAKLGNQVESKNFNHENGMSVDFYLYRASTTLEIILSMRRSWPLFLASLAGSMNGIMGAFGFALSQIERSMMYVRRFKKWAINRRLKSKKVTESDTEKPVEEVASNDLKQSLLNTNENEVL